MWLLNLACCPHVSNYFKWMTALSQSKPVYRIRCPFSIARNKSLFRVSRDLRNLKYLITKRSAFFWTKLNSFLLSNTFQNCKHITFLFHLDVQEIYHQFRDLSICKLSEFVSWKTCMLRDLYFFRDVIDHKG